MIKADKSVFIDKSYWAEGPWRNEADYYNWEYPNDIMCKVVRNQLTGAFEGYIYIPVSHPQFHIICSEQARKELIVHNGITEYFATSAFSYRAVGFIAFGPKDYLPRPLTGGSPSSADYRDFPFMLRELEGLFRQIDGTEPPHVAHTLDEVTRLTCGDW